MDKRAILFPGQGSQHVGMCQDVCERSPRAKAIFDEASKVLGYDLARLCADGPAQRLEQTDVQQPAIFVASAAIWAALQEAGVDRQTFTHAAGLSLGEYTALYFAGVISLSDGVRLVQRRGELMQAAATARPGAMVSLIGADADSAAALCKQARGDDVLDLANFNSPGQIVISGAKAACDRAVALADKFGCKAVPLAVAGAFHSAYMQPAADALEKVLAQTPMNAPALPVLRNIDATYYRTTGEVPHALTQQLTRSVRWQACVEKLIADGVRHFVEVGPGRVLTGLMRKIDRTATAVNVSTADAVVAFAKQGATT